ncbi:carotenoid oxygenase [Halteromyces radiatus]|uniref:carotenoid oxygenase n=1 Tax=Halteromyces radiatus TaxID=101107 RepID=UPI002220EC94|nr:carotenoid oxygenase [Halteromyces radiatus]KAI8081463.1 carotenoid oxygenase [Halteromyces radiatus]
MIYLVFLFTIIVAIFGKLWIWLSHYSIALNTRAIFQSTEFSNTPEVNHPVWLPIQGTLPNWLNGILYRIGPGRFILKDQNDNSTTGDITIIRHAFDGMPFLHRFQISATTQRVRYNSRHLSSKAEELIRQGKTTAFFGHVSFTSSTWTLFKSFFRRFILFTLQSQTTTMMGHRLDPSSAMVGVTPTPNYSLPKSISMSNPTLVTKTDANLLQKIHADSLEPELLYKYTEIHPQLKGELSAAHHQHDPETKEIFNFTLKIAPTPTLTVFCTTPSSQVTILAKITHRLDPKRTPIRPCYIHSFWLTKNYIIIPEAPLYFRNYGLDFIVSGSVLSGLEWNSSSPTYLHVISRRPGLGHIASLPVDSFFTFHVSNGWEEMDDNGTVLNLDCTAFPDGDIMHQLHTFGHPLPSDIHQSSYNNHSIYPPTPPTSYDVLQSNLWKDGAQKQRQDKCNAYTKLKQTKHHGFNLPPLRQSSFGELRRYRVDLQSMDSVSYTTLLTNVEFLRFNQAYITKPYRYVYGNQLISATHEEGERYNLVKMDLETKQTWIFQGMDYICSEPIFVPRPHDNHQRSEDDGVLLSFVNVINTDRRTKYCFLLVLDASTMKELARCHIGDFTATTFHGSFVDHEFKSISIN